MRLFLVAIGMWALAGCSRGDEAGAVRVESFYATFRPGCLTVTAADEADASRFETQQLAVGPQEQWAAGQGGTLVRWGP